ncbi:hypothetical protein A6770_40360 [Nostoc minutum NIES-26]|uniref:Uncharacterized protein n=1 Tax=Nostoc minutum NIES-26 TaxID=1844469 RepID=A0A367RL59_9NOSO|nr:hypothetical protein A6770_40360 [Nostoc minutum NIES-26]
MEREEQKDATIQLVGTLLNIGLGVAAFFATGGVAIFLGVAAALAGLGTAVYELEQADDLYASARAGEAGGKPLVNDAEEARFNLIMSWVNVLLAGVDLGFAVKGGTTLLEATSKARRMMKMHDVDVLSLLEANEIAEFKQAIKSLRTANARKTSEVPPELEQLKQKLTQRLGKEEGEKVFAQASSVFPRVELSPAKVSELNGFKDVLPSDLRDTVPIQVDHDLTGQIVKVHYLKVDGLVSEFYIQVAPGVKASEIREHVPTIKLMQRYTGLAGRVRVLRSQLGSNKEPRVGTKAWEAKFEIEKFEQMINTRVQKLAVDTSHLQDRIDGLQELAFLEAELPRFKQILASMDESPSVGYVAAQRQERWIRITENGAIESTNKPITDGISIYQDELKALRNLDSTALKDLTTEFGEQAVYQLIKRLKGQGLQRIYAAGGKNALKNAIDIIALENKGKIADFDDWITFMIKGNKSNEQILDILTELQEAKRLAGTLKNKEFVRVGGDFHEIFDRQGNKLPSFDLTVENKAGEVLRNVDVRSIKYPIELFGDLTQGIKYAIDKRVTGKTGTVEATIQIEIAERRNPGAGKRWYYNQQTGDYTIVEKDGSIRVPPKNIFQDVAENLVNIERENLHRIKENPHLNLIDR